MLKIHFVGDFFPGGVIVDRDRICSDQVLALLSQADIRVATLESAIGEGYAYDEVKMQNPAWRNIVFSPDRSLNHLNRLHIDVVTLANNHVYDLGQEGLLNTLELLDEMGVRHCGAGRNLAEAQAPAVVELQGKRIAFLAYMVYFEGWRAPHPAQSNLPGLNIFDCAQACAQIKAAKQQYDYVFVLPHWGTEYSVWPTPNDMRYARMMVDAGADGIFGSHPHQVQPVCSVHGKPVAYSMGNFIFPDFFFGPDRATWYPTESDNVDEIPVTYTYDRYPNRLQRRVWPDASRFGNICEVSLADKITCESIGVRLNQDNVLELSSSIPKAKDLRRVSLLMKTPLYRVVYTYVRGGFGRKAIKTFFRTHFSRWVL